MSTFPIPERGTRDELDALCAAEHEYGGCGSVGDIYVCREGGRVTAAFSWAPPAFGAAQALAPDCPSSVLALSRMVAVPKAERAWHISKPLRWLMRTGLDRTRWPVLVTYSDSLAGHTGFVYQCSRWKRDGSSSAKTWVDDEGRRRARYANGGARQEGLTRGPDTTLTRWVDRVCPPGAERAWMEAHGWRQVPSGKVWRSGNPGFTWTRGSLPEPRQLSLLEAGRWVG